MWTGNKYHVFLTFSLILQLQCSVWGLDWGGNCSIPCTCDQSYFADLSITTHWLNQEPSEPSVLSEPSGPQPDGNQATYEDEGPRGDLLKTAICMLQQDTQLHALLDKLPEDIQVLTLLQGRSSGQLSLEAENLHRFQDLVVLDIQGFPPDPDRPSTPLIVRNDALQPLSQLQYLNLEHVALLGRDGPPEASTALKPAPRKRKDKNRLVFLKPRDNELPIVSYSEYKEEIQKEGLATFAGISNLLFLRVFACNLRQVTWEMFSGLAKLQYLSLEHNDLLFVPDFAFYGTPHLVTLSLAGNKLLGLQDTALAGLLELQKLDLSSNNFSHLSELSLPPFPNLRVADFRSNPVEAVFPNTFDIMNATHVLYLGGEGSPLNLLANSFLGLNSLQTLTVANVRVPVLERELLCGMSKLVALQMTGDIPIITFDAFLEVPRLQRLVLSRCNVTAISMDAFYGLQGLISLDLSSNSLTTLPPGAFDQQLSLRELMLQGNQLTELPVNLLKHLPAKMIRLDMNPWHCSCEMQDWQATTINKVKQRGIIANTMCQTRYDKGSMCRQTRQVEKYVYDKRVEPRCATPDKYKDWNVFHLLRKELQCVKYKTKAYKSEKSALDKTVSSAVSSTAKTGADQESKPDKLAMQPLTKGKESETLSKKARQQLELQKEKEGKTEMKEIVKTHTETLSKKSYKLEMAKKREEKLKKIQAK